MPPPKKGVTGKRKSVTPSALRKRIAAGETIDPKTKAFTRLSPSTTQVLIGTDDIADWDDEELRRGRRRDRAGGFAGVDPQVVPKAITDELTRRLLSQAEEVMRDSLVDAVKVLVEIVQGEGFEAKDRLTATKMIMDRVMGKEPMRLELSSDKPWQVALKGGIVSTDTAEDEEDADD